MATTKYPWQPTSAELSGFAQELRTAARFMAPSVKELMERTASMLDYINRSWRPKTEDE